MDRSVSSPIRSASASGPTGWLYPSRIPVSMSAADATPSCRARIASHISNVPRRVVMKPGRSRTSIVSLPRVAQNASARSTITSSVSGARMTSTRLIAGTGLKKCRPSTCAGRPAAAVADADVVVEAVSEDLALKRSVWEAIGAAAMDHAVLASNTSGLPVQVLGAAAGRPAQVLGLHFFNPVPAMSLVEVIRAPDTDDVIVERALAFCATLGKETIEVRDLPGFITTRLGTLLMCEAIRALQEGVASAADIDTGMRLGYNHPVGPLALADRIGLDTLLSILDDLRVAYGDAFRAPPLLRQMVEAGRLGRKGGRGFYEYS